MKRWNRGLIAYVATIVVGIIFYSIYYCVTLNTTFQKAVLDQVDTNNVYVQISRTPTCSTKELNDELKQLSETIGYVVNQERIQAPICSTKERDDKLKNVDVLVMDQKAVQTILNQFSGVELQKVNEIDKKVESPYDYDVYIRQRSDNNEVISFFVGNSRFISIRKNQYYQDYKVISAFDYGGFRAAIDKLYLEK